MRMRRGESGDTGTTQDEIRDNARRLGASKGSTTGADLGKARGLAE